MDGNSAPCHNCVLKLSQDAVMGASDTFRQKTWKRCGGSMFADFDVPLPSIFSVADAAIGLK